MARGLGPVTSLSTSLASAHRHASTDGRATGGAQASAGGGAGGAALRVAVGVGQHALALRRCAPSNSSSGDGGATWRAEGEARHAQPVTAVLCTPAGSARLQTDAAGLQTDAAGLQTDGWLSAALDGQLLSGVAAEQGEARQPPPQARAVALPPVVEVATTYNKQAADSPPLAGGALFGIALSPCAALLVVLQRLPTLGSVRVKVRVRVRVRV